MQKFGVGFLGTLSAGDSALRSERDDTADQRTTDPVQSELQRRFKSQAARLVGMLSCGQARMICQNSLSVSLNRSNRESIVAC